MTLSENTGKNRIKFFFMIKRVALLMYIRNIIGPNTEYCGTPEITFWGLDILLLF